MADNGNASIGEFLRAFPLRAGSMMWLLGAGASAMSGIPTAYHMIWEFKRAIYCSENRISLKNCEDLADPNLQNRIQSYFDTRGIYPARDSAEEYAALFETAYPSDADRRRYIDEKMQGASPTYGHKVLAALMGIGKSKIVWTTNFDRLLEDAYSVIHGSGSRLTTVNLENTTIASEALSENRYPLYVKLHGDFQSRRLKNSPDELRSQNSNLSKALVDSCRHNGLVVVGYSGRDDSIMDALIEGIHEGNGFPMGLYWFHRSESSCLPRVQQLIEIACAKGIDAHILPVETFDELLGDVINAISDIPVELANRLNDHPRYCSSAPLNSKEGNRLPVIQFNALSITSYPLNCRKVVCEIGGYAKVQEAIAKSGTNVIATRCKNMVLCYGSDDQVKSTFNEYEISEFDIHPIEVRRLRYDSQEKGLLYHALSMALTRTYPLISTKSRRGCVIAVDPKRENSPIFQVIRDALPGRMPVISGVIPETNMHWSEAVGIKIDFRFDCLWLVIEPKIWVDCPDDMDATQIDIVKEFKRSKLVTRYNSTWGKLLDAWRQVICNNEDKITVASYGITNGVDAVFTIDKRFAFSRRG